MFNKVMSWISVSVLVGIAAAPFIGIGYMIIHESYYSKLHTPKFSRGSCVAKDFEQNVERWEVRTRYMFTAKILEVGNEKYLTTYWYGANTDKLIGEYYNDQRIKWLDEDWFEIDCESLDKIN